MKHLALPRFDWPSLRLTLTYLAIIMVLSTGFSMIFYSATARNFNVDVRPVNGNSIDTSSPGATSLKITISGSEPQVVTANDAAGFSTQVQESIHEIRIDLIRRLILLNVGALMAGSLFSYYLARRTLRPMEAAMEMQTRFSSDASHELRTPLTALRASNEVALRKPKLTLDEAKAVIRNSVDQAVKLEKLTDSLLRLSRNDGKGLARLPVSLEEIANNAMNQIVGQAQAKCMSVNDAVPSVMVAGDCSALVQAVTILLDNAIKYSEPEGIIYLEGGSEGKYGLLRVRDEGIGVRATDLPHVFERFYRADSARARDGEQSYGLGLSIAKKLVEQNGGSISAESTPGEGSVFTIKLPLARL